MLTIKELSKTYSNGVKALNGVNLSIDCGLFGLLGPNGAGKSSLMRTLASLQGADTGSIVFNGCNVLDNPQQLRAQLGYLPQEFGVYPRIGAFDLLEHFAVLKGITNKVERREQVSALLEQTNLHDARKKAVSTFSGGMRQRFGIAQALLGDPKLIIVDEPTAGLDPGERNRFHQLLSQLGQDRVVILSTHIVEDVRELCPNMAILAGGKILSQGKPEVLIEQLNGKVWRKTISPEEEAACREQFTVISIVLSAGQRCIHVLADSCPNDGFEAVLPNLEDVYFSVLSQQKQQQQ
jgi:ABC-type multidrug transport system ATPase subunit